MGFDGNLVAYDANHPAVLALTCIFDFGNCLAAAGASAEKIAQGTALVIA